MQVQPIFCLYCRAGDEAAPLINFRFAGQNYWICPQHLPLLIHQPGKLAGLLPGIERLAGYREDEQEEH